MKPLSITLPYLSKLDSLESADAIRSALDDKGVRSEIASVNWPERFPYRPMTTFAAAYSDKAIYVDFLVRCNYLRAENYENLSPVSQDSCVELFIDPKCDGEYWNFEFNCIGTINASRRRERPAPTRLSHEQLASVVRHPSCGTRPFREIEGLFTWSLLVEIPFELIGLDPDHLPEMIKGNFYKCASATSDPHYLSWSPIVSENPDFHRPEFFGDIHFAPKH